MQGLYSDLPKVSKEDLCEVATAMWEEGDSQGVKVDDEAPSMFTPAAVKAADQRIAEALEEYIKLATMGEEAALSKAKATVSPRGRASSQLCTSSMLQGGIKTTPLFTLTSPRCAL